MIIPAVVAFNGGDPSQINNGPGLMFITLPMVFESMHFGSIIGTVFFLLVLFAALTSSISLMETIVSVVMDKTPLKRTPATLLVMVVVLLVGVPSCLGYGPWAGITIIGMQFLDFFDFISNSVLMPIVAFLTCILIGHVVGTKVIADEVKEGAGSFPPRSAAPRHGALDRADPAGGHPCHRTGNQGVPHLHNLIYPNKKRLSDWKASFFHLADRQHLARLKGLLAAISRFGNRRAVIYRQVSRFGVTAHMSGERDHFRHKRLMPTAHKIRIILLARTVLVDDVQQVFRADICDAQRAVRADDLGFDIAARRVRAVGEHKAHRAVIHLDSRGCVVCIVQLLVQVKLEHPADCPHVLDIRTVNQRIRSISCTHISRN